MNRTRLVYTALGALSIAAPQLLTAQYVKPTSTIEREPITTTTRTTTTTTTTTAASLRADR